MEEVCDLSFHMKFLFTNVCQQNQKLHLLEQGVVLNFCKITEPRKHQLKIEIKHIKKNTENYFFKCFVK